MLAETDVELLAPQPHWIVPSVVVAFFAIVSIFLISVQNVWGLVFLAFSALVAYILKRSRGPKILRLSPAGFELILPFFRHFASWKEVGGFTVEKIGFRTAVVCDLSKAYIERQGMFMRLMTRLARGKGAIPAARAHSPDELASIMNNWRDRYYH